MLSFVVFNVVKRRSFWVRLDLVIFVILLN